MTDYGPDRLTAPLTQGVDHVGLTVRDLNQSVDFFVNCLGWEMIGEKPDYPAVFVSDGHIKITLRQVRDADDCVYFDRRNNIGLHHLALKVDSLATLQRLHERIAGWVGAMIEFYPEPSGGSQKIHMMITEPGGNRIEFVWDPR